MAGLGPATHDFPARARRLRLNLRADRTRDAGAAMAAIAVGVLGEILLVVVLGEIERAGRDDLGGDRPVAGLRQRLGVAVARGLGRLTLRLAHVIDRRTVLRADIIALAHALRRVMAFPEAAQQRVE